MPYGEGLRRSFATPNPFVLTNKICLNQHHPTGTVVYSMFYLPSEYAASESKFVNYRSSIMSNFYKDALQYYVVDTFNNTHH